jgi:DNA-binding CsgD family transcriptional regulator
MPELACLMLTSFADDQALFDAVMAGASGYVLKQIHGSDLVGAVRTVAAGESLLDPRSTAQMLQRLRARPQKDPLAALTGQERRILELIGDGLTNRQIGEQLFLAEKTIKNYVSNLFTKLDMSRRTQAAVDSSTAVVTRMPPDERTGLVTALRTVTTRARSHPPVRRPGTSCPSAGLSSRPAWSGRALLPRPAAR